MTTLYHVLYHCPPSTEILETHAVGETPEQAVAQIEKAGPMTWRIVSVQELFRIIPPDRQLLDLDEVCAWTGFSSTKIHARAAEMGMPMIKDGTLVFSRRHLELWRDRRFNKFGLHEAA